MSQIEHYYPHKLEVIYLLIYGKSNGERIANLKCFCFGHKLHKSYKGWTCVRCYADSQYSPRATHAITCMFSFLLAFALIGITSLYFVNEGISIMKIPCCDSMFPMLRNSPNGNTTTDFKPCWVVNQAVNENALKIGDVVTYKYKNNETIMHRLKAECNDTSEMYYYQQGNETYVIGEPIAGYIIQGDNVAKPDKYSGDYCVPAWSIQSRFKYKLFCLADYVG